MTEEEAKTKWCPHAGQQRYERQNELCIGSECMAWRWERDPFYPQMNSKHGLCGLAGART